MAFPVDESHILTLEAQIGWSLPQALRQRLRHNNGGEIEVGGDPWNLHPVWDSSDKHRMKRTTNHILLETQEARQWSTFPHDAITIAHDGTGDQLVVRPTTEMIERWDHETGHLEPVAVVWD